MRSPRDPDHRKRGGGGTVSGSATRAGHPGGRASLALTLRPTDALALHAGAGAARAGQPPAMIRQTWATRKVSTKPIPSGSSVATVVHFALRVSRQIV